VRKVRWTREELSYLKNNYGYLTTSEIAETLQRTVMSVHTKAFENGFKRVGQREYAVYFDDEFQFTGTIQECAQKLGIKEESFKHHTTPSGRKRAENGIFIVDLGMWKIEESGGAV
jgi:DNA-binding CsgD family transcriptional regulator